VIDAAGTIDSVVHDVIKFFRANPQVLALVLICLILGLGTFLAVMFGLISSGSTTTNGEPSGLVTALGLVTG
jgi:H+/gluconate symporter-like permease